MQGYRGFDGGPRFRREYCRVWGLQGLRGLGMKFRVQGCSA